MSIIYIFSALSGLYGLMWLIFVVIEPPGRFGHYFRVPHALYFVPERLGRLIMALIFIVLLPGCATFLVAMFTGG